MLNLAPEQKTLTRVGRDRLYWVRPISPLVVQFGYTSSYDDIGQALDFRGLKWTVANVDHCYAAMSGTLRGMARDRLHPDPIPVEVSAAEVWPVSRELVEYAWRIGCDDRTFVAEHGEELADAMEAFSRWRARQRLTERRPLAEFTNEVEAVIFDRWREWVIGDDPFDTIVDPDDWHEDYYGFNRLNDRRLLLRIGTETLARVLALTLQADGFRAEARGRTIDVFDRSEIHA